MELFIAEKPSVAREIAAWLEKNKHGAMKKEPTHIKVGDDKIVSWCFGHVLEQVEPHEYNEIYQKWRLDHLPIVPKPFKLKPKEDAAAQVRALGKLLSMADRVVHAGDPDDEGQLLVSELLDYFDFKKPVMRLWLNALDDTSITNAMRSMKSDSAYRGYYESALARSQADWLWGINMTRACSILGRRKGATSVITIGRVQTPTLALIVRRELEIRNFKAKDFYTPWIAFPTTPSFKAKWIGGENAPEGGDDRVDPEGYLTDKRAADAIVSKTTGQAARVASFQAKKKTESAPLPFSLSALQSLMSARYGMSAQQTLTAAQSLYEKKLTSYPRTDCEYLIEAQHADAAKILTSLTGTAQDVDRALAGAKAGLRSRAWNDKMATAHHAIIPLLRSGGISSLSPQERNVYLEVVKRYIIQFWPIAECLDTRIELICAGERFAVSGKTWTSPGWRGAFKDVDEDEDKAAETALPALSKDQTLQVGQAGLDASRTKAPKRYTEGTLLMAMKSVHKLVSNEKLKAILKERTGIGTEATRAQMIETLLKRGYVIRKGKDLVPTEIGEKLVSILPTHLTAPDMTAWWQQKMDAMKDGEGTHEPFILEQEAYLRKLLPTADKWFENVKLGDGAPRAEVRESEHECISCNSKLRHINGKFGWFFACSNEECKKLYADVDGKPVEKKPVKHSEHACQSCGTKLVEREGQYGPYYQCPSEKCRILYRKVGDAPEKTFPCPKCKKGRLYLRKGSKGAFWGCSRYKDGCKHTANDNSGVPEEK